MTRLPRIPDAQSSSIPSILETVSRVRAWLPSATRLEHVQEVLARLAAYYGYVRDRKAKAEVSKVQRRAELRIGQLLGPQTPGERTDKKPHHSVTRLHPRHAHEFRLLAKHAAEVLAALDSSNGCVVTRASLLNAIRTEERPASDDEPGRIVADLEGLIAEGFRAGTVYADPPWQYGNQGTRSSTDKHYPTMSVDAIAALPVSSLLAEKAHVHLWTTNAFLPESFRVLEAWGVEYKSCLVWIKPQMGIGNYWRVSHEFLLLGTKGKATFAVHDAQSWISADRTRHSAKPEKVRKLVESVSPGPRLELFGRNTHDGWTVLGNQVRRVRRLWGQK